MSLLKAMHRLATELPWSCDVRVDVGPNGRGAALVMDRQSFVVYGTALLDLDEGSATHLADEAEVMARLRRSVWERAQYHGRVAELEGWRP